MNTCKWCGRKYDEHKGGVYGGFLGLGAPLYCSEKCKKEAEASKASLQSNSSYDDVDHSTGLLRIIWKSIKWCAIILIIMFVYDNYIKSDKAESATTIAYSTTKSDVKNETPTPSSSTESKSNTIITEIKQVAYSWSESHNGRDLLQLSSLYAPQVNYYQSNYSREQIKASKEKLMNKYPDFKQEISNVTVEEGASYYKISFDKKVWTDLQKEPKTYPSYLYVNLVDGTWKIIAESDLVTDKNLSRKKK